MIANYLNNYIKIVRQPHIGFNYERLIFVVDKTSPVGNIFGSQWHARNLLFWFFQAVAKKELKFLMRKAKKGAWFREIRKIAWMNLWLDECYWSLWEICNDFWWALIRKFWTFRSFHQSPGVKLPPPGSQRKIR